MKTIPNYDPNAEAESMLVAAGRDPAKALAAAEAARGQFVRRSKGRRAGQLDWLIDHFRRMDREARDKLYQAERGNEKKRQRRVGRIIRLLDGISLDGAEAEEIARAMRIVRDACGYGADSIAGYHISIAEYLLDSADALAQKEAAAELLASESSSGTERAVRIRAMRNWLEMVPEFCRDWRPK